MSNIPLERTGRLLFSVTNLSSLPATQGQR
jgi:hypothetical protein